jgi:NAD(P)-dependent dehydrogenase (short-subunit alcohol dehydrogenase family)
MCTLVAGTNHEIGFQIAKESAAKGFIVCVGLRNRNADKATLETGKMYMQFNNQNRKTTRVSVGASTHPAFLIFAFALTPL